MGYQCGWCGDYFATDIFHDEHLKQNTECLHRSGPINPRDYDKVQVIIMSLENVKSSLIHLEKNQPINRNDNRKAIERALKALRQVSGKGASK